MSCAICCAMLCHMLCHAVPCCAGSCAAVSVGMGRMQVVHKNRALLFGGYFDNGKDVR